MVMVNPIEDPIINAPIPKKEKREKLSRSKSKREVRAPPLWYEVFECSSLIVLLYSQRSYLIQPTTS